MQRVNMILITTMMYDSVIQCGVGCSDVILGSNMEMAG